MSTTGSILAPAENYERRLVSDKGELLYARRAVPRFERAHVPKAAERRGAQSDHTRLAERPPHEGLNLG